MALFTHELLNINKTDRIDVTKLLFYFICLSGIILISYYVIDFIIGKDGPMGDKIKVVVHYN